MGEIKYVSGGVALLGRIGGLWKELNDHHADVSVHFSEAFTKFTFEGRKESLVNNSANGQLLVEIAAELKSATDVGYCITSITSDNKGEIESIYIRPEFRKSGIGSTLISRAIGWLDSNNVEKKAVAVAYGNESAFEFYSKFEFYPRVTMLSQKSEQN